MLAILWAVLSIDCSVEKGSSAGQAVTRRKNFLFPLRANIVEKGTVQIQA